MPMWCKLACFRHWQGRFELFVVFWMNGLICVSDCLGCFRRVCGVQNVNLTCRGNNIHVQGLGTWLTPFVRIRHWSKEDTFCNGNRLWFACLRCQRMKSTSDSNWCASFVYIHDFIHGAALIPPSVSDMTLGKNWHVSKTCRRVVRHSKVKIMSRNVYWAYCDKLNMSWWL